MAGYNFRGDSARVEMGIVFVGTQMEVDLVVGVDGKSIDLNLKLGHSCGAPVFHRRSMVAPSVYRQLEYETVELDVINYTTAFQVISGRPTFLGVLGNKEEGLAIVAVLTAETTVKVDPPPILE